MHTNPDTNWDYFFGINNYPLGGTPTVIDFNGDSWEDLALGRAGTGFGEGGVNVFLGGESLDPGLDLRYDGTQFDAHLGMGLGNIGDFNDDGIEDLAAGEPGWLTFMNWPDWGRVHVILGNHNYHQSVGVLPGKNPAMPHSLGLTASPNPFNPSTVLSFELRVASHVKLTVWDTAGRLVRILVDERQLPGIHTIVFDGSRLSSGLYFAKLEAGEVTSAKKLVLLK